MLRKQIETVWAKLEPGLTALKNTCSHLWERLSDTVAEVEGQERDRTEFLPAALEIIETPPAPAARTIAGTIIAFFVVALLWASIGSVDVIAVAQGRIVPTGRTKLIQPLEAGVVRAIHVQDGQQVKAGDVLLEIDPTINAAEHARLKVEVLDARLEVARLHAAAALSTELGEKLPAGATPEQISLQKRLLTNQVDEIKAKLANLDGQIAQNENNRAAIQASIGKIIDAMPFMKERAKLRHYLSSKGYGSKIENLTAQQDVVEHQKELEVQRSRLAEAEAAGTALKEQRRQTEAEYHRTTLTALAEAERKAQGLDEQLVQAAQRFRLQTLTAPVDGTVQQLAVHTEGGVVTPAQVLLAIVPADSKLEIEAMVSNRDIGFVFAGQDAEIKIDTFNFTKYGLLKGKVLSISQDAITRAAPVSTSGAGPSEGSGPASGSQSEPKGQELVYSARVALAQSTMAIDGKTVNLTPGMAVTVEIKTASRHVIEYLLSPLQRYKQQAMRER